MNLRDGSPESDSEVFLIGGKRRRIFIIVSFHLGKKHGKAGLGEQADEPDVSKLLRGAITAQ